MRKPQVVLRVHEMLTSRELERMGEATERRLLWPRHEAKQGRAFPGCEAAVAAQQSRRCAISNRCAMSQRQDAGRVARSETGKRELIHTLFGWRSGMCLRSGCVTRARLRGGVGQCPIALHVRVVRLSLFGRTLVYSWFTQLRFPRVAQDIPSSFRTDKCPIARFSPATCLKGARGGQFSFRNRCDIYYWARIP